MRIRLLCLGLLLSLALSGCSSGIKPIVLRDANGTDAVLRVGDSKDNYTYLTVDDLFSSMLQGTSNSQQVVFDAIQRAVIKLSQPITDDIKDNVSQQFSDWEDSLREEASAGNTSYSKLRKDRLSSMGYDSASEYRDELTYLEQKKTLEKEFWVKLTNIDESDDAGLSKLISDYVEEYRPYHLKHILVSLDESSSSNLYEGTITTDEAKKLASVCRRIADSSFNQVANDATTNADYHDNYDKLSGQGVAGDVGLMAINTAFYNQFKFGAYLFDIYSRDVSERDDMINELFQSQMVAGDDMDDAFGVNGVFNFSNGFNSIDISECDYLNNIASKDQWDADDTANKNGLYRTSKAMPRNIIFNQKFNNHDVGVITVTGDLLQPNAQPITVANSGFQYTTNFKYVKDRLGQDTPILTDINGNPIFYVRSSSGVHFMAIEKSPFDADAKNYFADLSEDGDNFINNAIETAQFTKQYRDAKRGLLIGQIQNTIRNEAIDAQATESNTANRNFDIRLIEHYRKENKIEIIDANFLAVYTNYINNTANSQAYSMQESLSNSITTYYNLLLRQKEVIEEEGYRYPMCGAFSDLIPTASEYLLSSYSSIYGSCVYSLNTKFEDDRDVNNLGQTKKSLGTV